MSVLFRICLIIVMLIGMVLGALSWWQTRMTEEISRGGELAPWVLDWPLFSEPQRQWAHRYFLGEPIPVESVHRALEISIRARPLYAPTWLLLAKLSLEQGQIDDARRYIRHAEQLWPTRGAHLWNVAMFWLRLNQVEEAARVLQTYLRAVPSGVNRVFPIMRRYYDLSTPLLKMLPNEVPKNRDADYYYRQALNYALRQKDMALALRSWEQLSNQLASNQYNASSIKRLINYLIGQKDVVSVQKVWEASFEGSNGPSFDGNLLHNGGFELPLAGFGLGWVAGKFTGGVAERVPKNSLTGDYSLQVSMDGQHNVNLYQPYQRVPVVSGQSYTLTGFWKGARITTRSAPFIEMYTMNAKKNTSARTERKRRSWAWQRFTLEIRVPEDSSFLTLRLRRHKTDALDKNIGGQVWLDDLRLLPKQNPIFQSET